MREKARRHLEENCGQWYHQEIKQDQESSTLHGAPFENYLETTLGTKNSSGIIYFYLFIMPLL